MRICVPMETDSGSASRISDPIGGSPFLVVIDTEKEEIEAISDAECQGRGTHDAPGWRHRFGQGRNFE